MLDWLSNFNRWLTDWDNFWRLMVLALFLAAGIFLIDAFLRWQDRKEERER